jgi:16S rRNA processing protein RimM
MIIVSLLRKIVGMSDRILIAQIATAHGVKGYVKLRYFGQDIEQFSRYNPFFTDIEGDQTLRLHIKNSIKGGYVASIEGITDRNKAETLRGKKLYISPNVLKEPEDGEYYCSDLIGCTARENGQDIGQIIAMENFGAGDLLEIKPASGASFYLPFCNEFVGKVDLAKKLIAVMVPEGLRE